MTYLGKAKIEINIYINIIIPFLEHVVLAYFKFMLGLLLFLDKLIIDYVIVMNLSH